MCNYTCWNWMGRKLPTAFNSQQLLRWLRPKRYIFSIFLVNKKLKKICTTHNKRSGLSPYDTTRNDFQKVAESTKFWTPKSRVLWRPESYFSDFSGKSRNLQNLQNLQKSQKSQKSAKSAKSRKSTIFCCLKATIRDRSESLFGQQKSQNLDFSQKCRFLKFCVRTAKITISQNRKKVENFRIFRPAKKSKKCAVCRGDRWSQMAAYFTLRRQKKRTFSSFFLGKGKKCTFFGNFDVFLD